VLTQVREIRKGGRDRGKDQPNGYAKTHACFNADSSWTRPPGTLKVGSREQSRAGVPLAAAAALGCRRLLPRVVFEAVDRAHAKELLARERARVESELRSLAREGPREADDRVEPGDEGSEDLYEDEADEGRREELEDELGAIGRAEARLQAGTFGLSVESGRPIPDARLEARPTAELTVEEQARRPGG
jgi:DnaK suppressor protein